MAAHRHFAAMQKVRTKMQPISLNTLNTDLQIAGARLVILEAAVGMLARGLLPQDAGEQLIKGLKDVKSDLHKLGIPDFKNSVISVLEEGPQKDGFGATVKY